MKKGPLLIALYAAVPVLALALAWIFVPAEDGPAAEIGKAFALVGASILLMQPVLAGRFKCLTAPFGLDMVIRFHRNMAVLALCLLILHPILIASEAGWFLLFRLDLPWYVWAGKIALLLLLINGLASLLFSRLPYSFEKWRLAHDVLGPAILVTFFLHAIVIGDDVHSFPLYIVVPALLAVSVAAFAYHRFIRPKKLMQNPYTVAAVEPESEDVTTLRLTPPEGESAFEYMPGQFHFLTLLRGRDLPQEEHHFTISSSPANRSEISSTIKASGDFTRTIRDTRPGDKAKVHGPFGRFSYRANPNEGDLAFIAGGIGVTPLMSMLRNMRDTGDRRRVVLLYANRTERDIVFRDELAEMEKAGVPELKVVHVLSRPEEGWKGETGHIDKKTISEHVVGDLERMGFYICGPGGLADAAVSALSELGVPETRIHREIFAFI